MSVSLAGALRALVLCGIAVAGAFPVRAADISGAMTADYLLQCESNQDVCRDFTNNVLQVLNSAAFLGQARIYKGCAPWPLDLADTGKVLDWILAHPQQATGYAADDIALAAQALWPCR